VEYPFKYVPAIRKSSFTYIINLKHLNDIFLNVYMISNRKRIARIADEQTL